MWTIPGVGTTRCDWPEGCPMVPEPNCDDIYGVFGGDQCKVYCAIGSGTETWECVGDENWKLVSEPATCVDNDGRAKDGETCEGFNEMTGGPFPSCGAGLECVSSGMITIPGAGNHCVPKKSDGKGEWTEGYEDGYIDGY